jgi:multidrug efflux pump subunit AcrA (membrane-fusion protein)
MARLSDFKWRLAGLTILVMSACAAGFMYLQVDRFRNHADPDRARKKGLPIPVRTVVVADTEVKEPIGATAITHASQIANIQFGSSRGLNWPASDVRLKAVPIWSGVEVHKGQVLFEVNDQLFQENAKQAQAEFEAAKSDLASVKQAVAFNEKIRKLELASAESEVHYRTQDHENRRNEYDTIRKLHQTKAATDFQLYDIVSKFEKATFDKAEADKRLEKAKDAQIVGILHDQAELDKAKSKFEKSRVELGLAKHDLERCQVRSPLDGFAAMVTLVPGAEVQTSQQLTQILKIDPIFVVMDYPQERIDDLNLGQEAEVVLDSFPKETFHGKVVRILPQVNPQLRVLPVTIEVSNPQNRIKADVSGYVRLWKNKKVTTVPTTALMQQGSKAMAFRIEGGRARIREVRVGKQTKIGEQEIVEGLAPGDEVVIFNQYYLQDNDSVDTDWRKWARRD